MTTRALGRTGIRVPPIGLGCMQFSGPGMMSAFFPPLPQPQVDQIVKTALDGGITWFDTAEMYGGGNSERSLSKGLTHAGIAPGDVTVATKWSPLARTAKSVERTIGDRLAALDPFPVDLHQIHMGYGSFSPVRSEVHAMARLVEAGKIRAVGVSNFSARQMEIAHAALAEHGLPLATNQVQVNLLHRYVETNWLITHYGDTVVAIPGASKPHHAEKAAASMRVALRPEETQRLTDLSTAVTS